MHAGPFVLSGQVTEEYGAVTVTIAGMRMLKGKPALPDKASERLDTVRSADGDWMRAA